MKSPSTAGFDTE